MAGTPTPRANPMDVDRAAPVIVAQQIAVAAPPARIWDLLTDIDRWPAWNPDIASAVLDGPVAMGSTFRWTTAGLAITSTIGEAVPGKRIGWSGDTNGIVGIHLWTIEAGDLTGRSSVIQTVESWNGDLVRQDPETMRGLLQAAIKTWLGHLRTAAETATSPTINDPERR